MAKSNSKRRKRRSSLPAANFGKPQVAESETTQASELVVGESTAAFWAANKFWFVAIAAVFLYAYWPTLTFIEDAWRNEPDYSHGYLVPILAGMLCWYRRDSFPGIAKEVSWAGIGLIVLAIIMRVVGRLAFAEFLDGWSIVPMVGGIVWLLFGFEAFKWALPPILFLILMIPLPYQAESLLSWKLQGFATQLSTVFLRVLGQPAVSEGHVIWLNDQRLLVEEACSGLRIFIGVAALAFFWAALANRSWVDRVILLASAVPLAILVNAIRITVVGMLYQQFDDVGQQNTIHDVSGYLMIPLAFGLLWLIKAYWEHLYRPVEQLTAKDFVRATT